MTWLGTSSGAPTLKRNVSCIAVRLPNTTFLVDAGEGSCRQVPLHLLWPATCNFCAYSVVRPCWKSCILLQLLTEVPLSALLSCVWRYATLAFVVKPFVECA